MQNNIGEARRSYALVTGRSVTQDDAARMFGVSPSGYKKWEQGQGKLNGEVLCLIADAFGCSVDYLLKRTDDPTPYASHRHDSDTESVARRYAALPPDMQESVRDMLDVQESKLGRLRDFQGDIGVA